VRVAAGSVLQATSLVCLELMFSRSGQTGRSCRPALRANSTHRTRAHDRRLSASPCIPPQSLTVPPSGSWSDAAPPVPRDCVLASSLVLMRILFLSLRFSGRQRTKQVGACWHACDRVYVARSHAYGRRARFKTRAQAEGTSVEVSSCLFVLFRC
jgi:hypothetical protein